MVFYHSSLSTYTVVLRYNWSSASHTYWVVILRLLYLTIAKNGKLVNMFYYIESNVFYLISFSPSDKQNLEFDHSI